LVVSRHKGPFLFALVAAISLVATVMFRSRHKLWRLARDVGSPDYPLYVLMLFFVVFLACAVTIDIGVLDPWSTDLPVVEELFELCAAIALLFSGYFVYRSTRQS
jgi:hypothetical protein